nr:amidohydrolase family protein [Pseudobdellovibrionaceae bacterium]
KLAKSQVTAVLLPSADLYMKCNYPPAKKMIEQGVRVALSTDFNPGSSPSLDLQLAGVLARLQMEMSLPQVLAAYSVGASFALGLEKEIGSLEVGKYADFIGTSKSWQESFYTPGSAFTEVTYSKGRQVYAKQ